MLPKGSWQTAVTGAVLLSSSVQAADLQTYIDHATVGIETLNAQWYNGQTGIWDNAWWNSGNALTMIADFTKMGYPEASKLDLGSYLRNTLVRAQRSNIQSFKTHSEKTGMTSSTYCINGEGGCASKREFLGKRGFNNFINEYYDDEGWWALGLIHSYDATGDPAFLDAAVRVFQDMQGGTGTPCGGGIFWNKDRRYVNAIANELYLSVAASLANRIPNNSQYLSIARSQWNWFMSSGMVNSDNLINDGLTDQCQNNGQVTWSYNQGVILGAAAELTSATGDASYIRKADDIARAAIAKLSNSDGILVEADMCELRNGHCGRDGQQFKGVFVRNLGYLNAMLRNDDYSNFIKRNADSIWANDRHGGDNKLGVAWFGPYIDSTGPAHSSALDVLIAAVSVAGY